MGTGHADKGRKGGYKTEQETPRGKKNMDRIGHIHIDRPFCSACDVCLQQLSKRLKLVSRMVQMMFSYVFLVFLFSNSSIFWGCHISFMFMTRYVSSVVFGKTHYQAQFR